LQQRLSTYERDADAYETKLNQLLSERENLKIYIRELEQKNDDLERTNRVVSESVAGFEAMLNQAYEKNALLEMEIDEKEAMQINLQRLMDEARDLKQELKIRNISLPTPRHPDLISDKCTSVNNTTLTSTATTTTTLTPATKSHNVSKLNDINDSKNNNSCLSLNASLDKTSSTTLSLNNSSLMDTTLNASGSTTLKSQSDSMNHSTQQSVLKCKLSKVCESIN